MEARDLSLAELETFNKKPPPIFVDGPIGFRLDARIGADQTVQSLEGHFTLGAGRVRLNNPDATPFLVDEASGRVAWDNAAKRLRIEDLAILAGETHVGAHGWVAPPANAADPWVVRMDSNDMEFGPERPGLKPVTLNAVAAQAQLFSARVPLRHGGLFGQGANGRHPPHAEAAPDGSGVSLKLNIRVNPSVTPDVIRLWPQFINPDVRDWCSHNLHGGQIQGEMNANWSAQDLDAMDHKRAVARESVRGSFSTHDVGVDLMPGLPTMMSSEGSGSFTGRDFSLTAASATMTLAPTRRILADNVVFTIPDTSPREIVDAKAQAHLSGTADSLADLLGREPLRKQAGLQLDPATVRGQAEGNLTLALKLGKTAKPEDSSFQAVGALSNLTLDKFIGEEKPRPGDFDLRGGPQHAENVGAGDNCSLSRPGSTSPARLETKGRRRSPSHSTRRRSPNAGSTSAG